MRIGEVAQAAGVSTSTIRYYEAAGIMPLPVRRNGARYYDADAIDELRILRFYRASGIPIRRLASISKLQRGTSARRDVWIDVLRARIVDLESWIQEAERTRGMLERAIECRCDGRRDDCVVLQAAEAQAKQTRSS
jgi:DNA-binding transcriptional MerR regulator